MGETSLITYNDNEDDCQPYPLNHPGEPDMAETDLIKSSSIIDIIEFYCHKILVEETSIDKLCEYYTQLGHHLSSLDDNEECIYSHGRLHSRLTLVALIYEVLSITSRYQHEPPQDVSASEGKDEQEIGSSSSIFSDDFPDNAESQKATQPNYSSFFSLNWQYEDWKRLEEQLVLAKSIMSCGNANQCILPSTVSKKNLGAETASGKADLGSQGELPTPPLTSPSSTSTVPTSASGSASALSPDGAPQTEKNADAFEDEYEEVLRLLQVHSEIAKFYQRLQVLKQKQIEEGSASTKKAKMAGSEFLKRLENTVNEYASGLNKIFHDNAFVMDDDDDDDDADAKNKEDDIENGDTDESDKDDDEDNTSSNDGAESRVSTFLISSLLPELYQRNTDSLLDRLMEYLSKQIVHNPKNEFSYEQVQRKYRAIIIKWSNMVLEPPLLVQNSEGLAPAESEEEDKHLYVDDDDDVSSWGEDDGELLRSFDNRSNEVKDDDDATLVGTEVDIPSTVTTRRRKDCNSMADDKDSVPLQDEDVTLSESRTQKRKRSNSDSVKGVSTAEECGRQDNFPAKKARSS